MRIAIGQFQEESNTFVLQRADLDFFARNTLLYGEDVVRVLRGSHAEMGAFLDVLAESEAEVVPLLAAHSVSSGPVPRATFERLLSDLLRRLAAAGRVDGLLLSLHGAMVLDDAPDADGEILAAARAQLGPDIPIVASLDLHGHITLLMVEAASGLVGYDTYPHVDLYEAGAKAARMVLAAARGELHPVTVLAKAPIVVPAEGMGTSDQPMADLMAWAKDLERQPGVLSTSLFAVQPWLDVPDLGFAVVVVTDGLERAHRAAAPAREIAASAWSRRHEFDAELLSVDDGIARGLAVQRGPVVLSESADGTGAGSPGDSAAVLERLLALDVQARCLVSVVDPPAVAEVFAAGVGADVALSVGGAIDPRYNRPVPLRGRVRLLSDGRFVYAGKEFTGEEASMGRAAVVETEGGIQVLLMEQPVFTTDPSYYRAVGLEPSQARIVVVKSALQFRDGYGDFAEELWVVDTAGPSPANLARLDWHHLTRPLYPFDDAFQPEISTTLGARR
ncbi:MAG: M81 family metallopeptidase [Chloroflexi bacterium]|nr:M81 family metallopeptidase [Chloroflexota bacterium]